MKTGSAFFIALRYLLGRAREGGRYLRGAATGIALSLVPVIVTLIVADGMIRGITDRYLELGTGHLQVYNYQNPESFPLDEILELDEVRGAWIERLGIGVVFGTGGSMGTTIRAIESDFWDDEGSRRFLNVISGEGKPGSDRELLLGEQLARSIGAEVGSSVRIMTFSLSDAGRPLPRVSSFTVGGIVSSGYRELDALWTIITLEAGRQALPHSSRAHLMLKIDDPYEGAGPFADFLSDFLGPGYGVHTWQTLQFHQYSSYQSTRQLLLFIMALIVLVAAVNVSSATTMLVIERQREIAILKTSGARPSFTSGIFIWGAFLTGLIGSVLGIAAGLAIGSSVNVLIRGLEAIFSFFTGLFNAGPVTILDAGFYLETIPILINWELVFYIGLYTILCSVLASWFPARRAGKMKPIDILRKY